MQVRIHKTYWCDRPGGPIDSRDEVADIPDDLKSLQEELNRLVEGIAITESKKGYLVAYNTDSDFFYLPWNQWASSKGLSLKGTVVEL